MSSLDGLQVPETIADSPARIRAYARRSHYTPQDDDVVRLETAHSTPPKHGYVLYLSDQVCVESADRACKIDPVPRLVGLASEWT